MLCFFAATVDILGSNLCVSGLNSSCPCTDKWGEYGPGEQLFRV